MSDDGIKLSFGISDASGRPVVTIDDNGGITVCDGGILTLAGNSGDRDRLINDAVSLGFPGRQAEALADKYFGRGS